MTLSTWVLSYGPILRGIADDLPMDMLLGWIERESGGKIGSTGLQILDERGLFQLTAEDSRRLGYDHNLVGTDPQTSLEAGVALVRDYANRVEQLGYSRDDAFLFWRLVKLMHAIGAAGLRSLLGDMRAIGIEPSTWDSIESFWHVDRPNRKDWPASVNAVFDDGKLLALAAGLINPTVGIPLVLAGIGILLWLVTRRKKRTSAN